MEEDMKYKHYTVGFYLNFDLSMIMLVRKAKPIWQKGLYNGVGGFIEKGESAHDCMIREFEEETGIQQRMWTPFATGQITCHQGPCYLHYMITSGPSISPRLDHSEQAEWLSLRDLFKYPIVPNITWLIQMGLLKFNRPQWVEKANFQTL